MNTRIATSLSRRSFLKAAGALGVAGSVGLASCAPATKKVTLNVKLPVITMSAVVDPDVSHSFDWLQKAGDAFTKDYKDYDVTLKFEQFEYTDETAVLIGTKDTPNACDMLYEGYFNMGTYIHNGNVVPLDDIISDSLKSDIDDAIWAMGQADGKNYEMPYLALQNVLVFNKDMFNAAGLEKYTAAADDIQNWTITQWEEVLDTLAANLPGGSYPLMMYGKNDQGDTHIMTFIRSHGCDFFDNDGNFVVNTPEGIAALDWLQKGVDRGWYPPNPAALELADNGELFANQQLAILLTNSAFLPSYLDKGLNIGMVNFPHSTTPQGICTSFVTGFQVWDNGDADKVAVAKAFVKYIMETSPWNEYSAGSLPVSHSVAQKYANDVLYMDSFSNNAANVVDFTHNDPNWRGVRDVFWPNIRDLLSGTVTPEQCAANIDSTCNAAVKEGRDKSTLHA
ncbi:MAG: substrate-binding domain-containing protein [Coriobacteriia bacterium]|nr:substrate-binding domain-containing protein [Coriobacteriia bacterium]